MQQELHESSKNEASRRTFIRSFKRKLHKNFKNKMKLHLCIKSLLIKKGQKNFPGKENFQRTFFTINSTRSAEIRIKISQQQLKFFIRNPLISFYFPTETKRRARPGKSIHKCYAVACVALRLRHAPKVRRKSRHRGRHQRGQR